MIRNQIAAFVFCLLAVCSFPCEAGGRTYVRGYVRSNGTYVAPHYRTSPDASFYNNWSSIGNVNPYTGKVGTKTDTPTGTALHFRYSSIPEFVFAPIPNEIIGTRTSPSSPVPTSLESDQLPRPEITNEISQGIQAQASRQWPSDFSMQAYTIRRQQEGYVALQQHRIAFSTLGVPVEVQEWALQNALTRWPGDYSMQAYDYERSLEGYLQLSALVSSQEYRDLPAAHAQWMSAVALGHWAGDFSMQAYALEKQIDGYYELSRLYQAMVDLPSDVTESIKANARGSWPEDLSMQAYEVRRQTDGYRKLQQLTR
jgi:hypothetical protein